MAQEWDVIQWPSHSPGHLNITSVIKYKTECREPPKQAEADADLLDGFRPLW